MIASIKKLVVLLLLILPAMLPAQETGNTETKETWLSIIRVNNRNDSALVMMAGARAIGLQKGQLVKAYSKSRKAVEGVSTAREFAEIGSGSIVFSDSLPLALIRLYKQTDTLEEGDLVMVKLEVPLLPYRGIFSDLAFSNIIFTDVSKFPHYTLPGVIKKDSRKAEDSLFNVISKGLHDTYEAVKDRTGLPEDLLKKSEKGRFKGRSPLEVIRDATRKDIESFFLYVIDYPVGYMGMDYRASESFAGWLVSNSPYSAGEVRNALMPVYRNKEQMKQQVLPFRADVLSEHISSTLANKALPLAANRQYKEANELVDFSIALGEAVNDVVALPEVYLGKAQVKLEEDKYAESITWCEKTIKAAVSVKDRDKESQALIKKGFCQVKLSRLAEAEQTFKNAGAKLELYRKELGEDYYLYRRKIYEYTSSARYIDGKYAEALRLLDTAIAFNNRINSYDANSLNAVYYKFIGQVYNEQNRPEDALQAFTKAANIYRGLLDAEKFGEIQNERALSYYKLGSYQESIELSNEAMSILLAKRNYDGAGYSRSLAGNCYQALGNYDSAVVANKDAIALRKKGGNRAGEAVAWENIANVFRLSGSKKLSLQAYDTAALLYQLAGDKSGLADVYNGKGRVYLGDENYKTATEWFEKAKGISNKSTVQALYRLGLAWRTIDSAKARAYFLQARSKSMEDGNTDYQFSACRSLAGMAWELQENALGDKYYAECEAISREMKTAYAKALCYSLKGYRFEVNTELDSALHYYHLAMTITDTADRNESVSILNSVASVLISKGEFRQAEAALNKAIRLAEDIADTLGLASTLQFSSFLYSRTAEFDKGLVNSNRAISILSQSGHIIRLAGAYGSRGVLFSSMGENKKSVEAYLYADSLYNEELQAEQRGNIFNNIGIVYTGQGDYTTALKYLQKSLATMKKGVVNEGYLLTQGNIADCYAGMKKNKEARELLLDILPRARKMKLNRIASGMAITLGKIYLEDGKLNEAKQYYQYARDYADASGEQEKMVEALVNLGRISSRENNRPDAENSLRQSIKLAKQFKLSTAWESYYELGLLFYNNQQADSAIVYFKQAVELLDRTAENLYGGEEAKKIFDNDPRKADLYNKLVFAYYNTGNINDAWTYANRSSIAGIKELSGSLSVNTSNEEKNESLRKLLAMQQSKKALENTLGKQEGAARQETLKKIEILEADYNNFLQDVVEKYPELSTYFSRSNADEFNNYKGKLPDDLAVALYLVNDKTLMIFTLTNEKLAVDTMTIDLAPRINVFSETIRNTKKETGTGPLSLRSEPQDEETGSANADFKDIADELYRVLIATVEDKVGQKKKLCIIPTGVFSNMPFQCLGKKTGNNQFRFLIEDHQLFYTNKMSVFNMARSEDSGRPPLTSFAVFGVPDATLHFNIEEAISIGRILGADSTVYTDNRATESMAKKSLRNKQYIHFATHGVLNYSSDYSQSYLKLLPDKDTTGGNNGQLTMREVQKLGINDCEMVILSACQTAVSKELTKGWSISPANSFLVSKVRSVVASLWKVADEPTGLLMEYFYENLQKKMDKAEALRQAQIKLSQDSRFRHPNYWGAFVLYGEWR